MGNSRKKFSSILSLTFLVVVSLIVISASWSNKGDASITYFVGRFDSNAQGRRPHNRRPSRQRYLGLKDFDDKNNNINDNNDDSPIKSSTRYESNDHWRADAVDAPNVLQTTKHRYPLPSLNKYRSKGEYLQQPLVADYAKGSEKVFFMIKTGGSVLWNRLPIHLMTSLTRVPNFALYSDAPGSVGGHEVIDILQNSTKETLEKPEFTLYRRQRYIHDSHGVVDYSELDVKGGWELDKFKNIPMLADAYAKSPKSDWFVFMDADSYFMMDTLMEWLNTFDPEKPHYFGSRAALGDLIFGHGGSGVVLSRKAVELTVGEHPEYVQEYEQKAFKYCCGDALVALMLKEKLGLEIAVNTGNRFQGNSFWEVMVTPEKWCQPIASFHHLTAHDIEILWEYERLIGPEKRKHITYGDIYHDFYLPYIKDRIDNWDNKAEQVVFTPEKDKEKPKEGEERPYSSFEACQKACDEMSNCLMFRYLPNKSYCGLSKQIKLGRPAFEWVKEDNGNHKAISGWKIDRIRQVRKSQSCDPLSTESDSEQLHEGWFNPPQLVK